MKKMMNIVSIILFILIILVLVEYINIKNGEIKIDIEYTTSTEVLGVDDYDESKLSKEKLNEFLNKTYFENDKVAGFNSTPLDKELPDLEYLGWYSIIISEIGMEYSHSNEIAIDYILSDYFEKDIDDLYDIHLLHSLCNVENDNMICEETSNEIITKFYDENSGMYYRDDNENVDSMIEATYYVHRLNEEFEMNISIRPEVEDTIINIFENHYDFCYENSMDIMDCGGNLVYILTYYGYTNRDFDVSLSSWFQLWMDKIDRYDKNDFFTMYSYHNMLGISRFFDDGFQEYVLEFLDYYISDKGFLDLGIENDRFFIDPLNIYVLLDLFEYCGEEFPFYDELHSRIIYESKSGFLKNYGVNINVIDNYYGLALSNLIDFEYDKEKSKNLINEFLSMYLSNPELVSFYEVLNLYFLVMSMNEFDEELELNEYETETISKSIVSYLENINYNSGSIDKNLVGIQYSLEILGLLETNLPLEVHSGLTRYLETIKSEDVILQSSYISEYLIVAEMLGYEPSWELLSITSDLYLEGGYVQFLMENIEMTPDIISTMKICRIEECNEDENKIFLSSLVNDDETIRISLTDNYMDLRVIYYYIKLSSRK